MIESVPIAIIPIENRLVAICCLVADSVFALATPIVSIPDLYLRWNRTSLSKSPRRRRSAARRPNARLYLIPRGEHDLARVYAESVAPLIAPESADHRLDTSKTRMKSPHVAIKTDTAVAHWGPCLAWIDIDLAALQ